MVKTKSLVKDSAIYGGTTIIVKLASWLTTPLFTYSEIMHKSDFGMITNIYAYAAFITIILAFGMETGLFRFINQSDKYKPNTVYSTVIMIVSAIVLLFLISFSVFFSQFRILWSSLIPDSYIRIFILITCMDGFIAVPFAWLRYKKKPLKFGFYKLLQVVLYVIFCTFFLVVCPWINKHNPELINWFWRDNFCVGYILISNLLATGIQTLCLLPYLTGFKYSFDWRLAKTMLNYCFPLVIMGLAGISNQVLDKLIFPVVFPDGDSAYDQLGVYGACFKIAMIMVMFTQAFRYAFDPFIFEKNKDKDAKQSYAIATKYFVILGLLVFLAVIFYIDIFKYFVAPDYWEALPVVAVVLIGELFFAVYYNLSIWYKLTDKTYWGTFFSIIGFAVVISLNITFIPIYGYMACSWASFIGNGLIMILSYFIGQKYYPVRYDLKNIAIYTALAACLYAVSCFVPIRNQYLHIGFNTVLLAIYIYILVKRDLPLKDILYKLVKR
ncbi:MAG: oligosaccharide flippase family protein [Dysgonamonadaceae bacterium]|jgi:O-antigen/teichoic acid export membrane protein|nr:oligosaccharide flippase family protein [Dysgonamonadaceae bacterium]